VTAAPSDPRVAQPWELMSERPRTDGWVPVITRTYRMPDGSVSDWDVHDPSFRTVAVLALTEDDADDAGVKVVLVRQFRPGPGEVLWELPGGIVDDGEGLAEAAARELLEETGYRAGGVEVVGGSWAFGASTWRRTVVVARGCTLVAEPTSWGGDEYCEPRLVTLSELRAVAREGRSSDVDLVYLALDATGLL
jgi:ADP-ribose pyrophosphatase